MGRILAYLVLAAFFVAACETKYADKDAGHDSGKDPDGDSDGEWPDDIDGGWPDDIDGEWPDDLEGRAIVTLTKHTIDGSIGGIAFISFRDRDVTIFPAGPEGTSPVPVGIAVNELSRIGFIVYTANPGTGSVRLLDISQPDPIETSSAAVFDPADPPELVAYRNGLALAISGKSNILYVWNHREETNQAVALGESEVTLVGLTGDYSTSRTYVMDNTGTASGRGSIFILDRDAAQVGRIRYEDLTNDSSGPLMAVITSNGETLYVVNSHTDDLSCFSVDGDSLVHVSDHSLAPSDFGDSHGIEIGHGGDKLYLLADNTHEVLAVSTDDFSIERFPLDGSDNPAFLSLDVSGKYLLVPSPRNDCIYVLETPSGYPVLRIPLPESSEPMAISEYW